MAARRVKGWWYADFRHEGVRYRRRSPENTRAGAQAYELHLRQRLARGEDLSRDRADQAPLTFEAFAQEWFETYGLVFHCGGGAPLTYERAREAIRRMCGRAGIRHVTWHCLRHTFATQLCEERTPIREVQALLGHSSLAMTERYTHVNQGNLASAIACLHRRQMVSSFGQPVGNAALSRV